MGKVERYLYWGVILVLGVTVAFIMPAKQDHDRLRNFSAQNLCDPHVLWLRHLLPQLDGALPAADCRVSNQPAGMPGASASTPMDTPSAPTITDGPSGGDFALLIRVVRKDPSGKPLEGARVSVKGIDLERNTDSNGMAGPLPVALPSTERFPYEVEVRKEGFKTCVIKFGSMVFPGTGRWWEKSPHRLFVYVPEGQGVATGDECYGGRTQPQTPGR